MKTLAAHQHQGGTGPEVAPMLKPVGGKLIEIAQSALSAGPPLSSSSRSSSPECLLHARTRNLSRH